MGFNWFRDVDPSARDEYNVEFFYRFPLVPELDVTVSYQNVINPAFTTLFDTSSVFSLHLVGVF
ncbi:MAG: carbohydrate porin [Hyphomicrobiaceae bacterium]